MTVGQSVCLEGKYPPIVNDIEEDLFVNGKKGIGIGMGGHKQLNCNNHEYFSPTQQPCSEVIWFGSVLIRTTSKLLSYKDLMGSCFQKILWDKSSEFFELWFLDDLDLKQINK